MPIRIFDTENTETHPRPKSRLRAIDGDKTSPVASLRLEPSPSHRHHPAGLPASDATRKFALRAKDTERNAFQFIRVLRPSGRISVTRGKPKTQRVEDAEATTVQAVSAALAKEEGLQSGGDFASSIARQGDSASPAFPRFPCQNPPHGIDAALTIFVITAIAIRQFGSFLFSSLHGDKAPIAIK